MRPGGRGTATRAEPRRPHGAARRNGPFGGRRTVRLHVHRGPSVEARPKDLDNFRSQPRGVIWVAAMSIIEFIRDRARFYNCPVCGRSFKGCDVQVLSHEEERFHLQVTCSQCQVTFVVVLAIAGSAVEETIGATELIEEPVVVEAEPITVDEILALHLMVKGVQGALEELIQQPDQTRASPGP